MTTQLIGGPQDGLTWKSTTDPVLSFCVHAPTRVNEPRLLHVYELSQDGQYHYTGVDVEETEGRTEV